MNFSRSQIPSDLRLQVFIPLKNDVAGEMLRCTFSSLTQLLLDESSVHHSSPLVSFPIYHQATWKVSESVESVQKLSAWQMTLFLSTKPCYTWLKNHRKMSHLELRQFHKIAQTQILKAGFEYQLRIWTTLFSKCHNFGQFSTIVLQFSWHLKTVKKEVNEKSKPSYF